MANSKHIRIGGICVGKTAFNSGDGERGPGWYDVNVHLRDVYLQSGGRIRLAIEPVASVNAKWGLRVVVRMVGNISPIGTGGYGPAFAGGSKTLSSACFLALNRAREWLEAAGIGIADVPDV